MKTRLTHNRKKKIDFEETACGVLNIYYNGKDLMPNDINITCPDTLGQTTVALGAASRSFNSSTTAVTTSCKCKSACK